MVTETLEKTDWEYRADSGKLGDWQLTPEGYLVANAKIARIGIQEYQNPDGTVRREFRPPEEVANRDSLKTLCDLPVSIEHPPVMLDSKTAKAFAVGWNGSVTYDGGFVSTKIKLIDGKAVQDALNGGRIELSVGYVTKLDWVPGAWEGQKYDCIQREIRGNHIALTVKARGGSNLRLYPSVSLKKDSAIDKNWQISAEVWPDAEVRFDSLHLEIGGESNMKMYEEDELIEMSSEDLISLVLDMQSQMSDANDEIKETKDSLAHWQGVATAYEDSLSVESELHTSVPATKNDSAAASRRLKEKDIRIAELESRIDSSESENDALRRRLDESKARVSKLDTDLTDARECQEREIVRQREDWINTWNQALPFLPATAVKAPDYTLDSIALMRLALQNHQPGLNLDSLTESASNPDDVIKTAFSVMVAAGPPISKSSGRYPMRLSIEQAKADSLEAPGDIRKIQASIHQKQTEAWRITN